MTVEKEVARLSAIVEATLGPNGSFTTAVGKMEAHVEVLGEKQNKQEIRLDRLEQSEKRRSRWIGAFLTAWVGLAATWVWERLH